MSHSVGWSTAVILTGVLLSSCGSSSDEAAKAAPSSADSGTLSLVVIGDSIPNNSPGDCPGCTGFVDRYAAALEKATGKSVVLDNSSEHTGLTLEGLVAKFEVWKEQLAGADAIIVAIAHNSSELASEAPCGSPLDADGMPDWSAVDRACAVAAAKKYRPMFASMYADVAALREGKPTILRTVNRYNDWIGWADAGLTPHQERKTQVVLNAWNVMICQTAEESGFGCADIATAFNGSNGLRPSGGLLADDYTHPSDRGNAVIARQLVGLGFEPLA